LADKSIVLVTGATGAVGPSVVQAINEAGYQIRAFSIDNPAANRFPLGVEVLFGDVTSPEGVQSAMQGVDTVVHLAAILHLFDIPPQMRKKIELVNIGGTETVVKAAIKARVRRIILFSTIAVYGPSKGVVLDEFSPTKPETLYAQTKLAAERIVLNARGIDGRRIGTVLRLSAVYGSSVKGNYERLIRALARNRFIPFGDGQNRRTLVYEKDVGRAAVLAVSHPAAAGRVFNVTDGKFHTLNEITRSICDSLGRKPPMWPLPAKPVRLLVRFYEKASRTLGIKPIVTMETINKYEEDIAVDGSLFQNEIGFMPQFDLKAGCEETIHGMRA
jgi:UDP-glucose 4-epimerase